MCISLSQKIPFFNCFIVIQRKRIFFLKIFAQRSQWKAIRGHKSCQTLRIVRTEAAYPVIVHYLKIMAFANVMSKFWNKGLQKAKDCCHSYTQNNYHFTIDFDLNIFQLKKYNNRLLTSLAFSIWTMCPAESKISTSTEDPPEAEKFLACVTWIMRSCSP